MCCNSWGSTKISVLLRGKLECFIDNFLYPFYCIQRPFIYYGNTHRILGTNCCFFPARSVINLHPVVFLWNFLCLFCITEKSDWNQLSGTVYSGADDITQLATAVYREFVWSNPLHADVFPAVRQMEAEVIRICCTLFNGDADTCGSVWTGATTASIGKKKNPLKKNFLSKKFFQKNCFQKLFQKNCFLNPSKNPFQCYSSS